MQCDGFIGPCDSQDAVKYRMHTAYENEASNYMNLCPFCQKECDDYWEEMWRELNNDIMLGIKDSLEDQRRRTWDSM